MTPIYRIWTHGDVGRPDASIMDPSAWYFTAKKFHRVYNTMSDCINTPLRFRVEDLIHQKTYVDRMYGREA